MILAVLFFSTAKADVGDAKKFHHMPLTLHKEGVIRVMVVDTGVDFNHPLLQKFLDADDAVTHPEQYIDYHGHGTHITGLILYGYGIQALKIHQIPKSVCHQVQITSCKYFPASSQPDKHNLNRTIDCFKRAVAEDFDVVNYSAYGADPSASEYEAIVEMKINGILLMTSAGNNHINIKINPQFPEGYAFGTKLYPALDNVIPLMALGNNLEIAKYSNYGRIMPMEVSSGEFSTLPQDGYGIMYGTSQATAIYLHKLLVDKCKEFDKPPQNK